MGTKMNKKEVISRLKFWIRVLEQEETPEMVDWQDFCHLMKISALSRMEDYMGITYEPVEIMNIYNALLAMEKDCEDGKVYDRDDIRKSLKDYGQERFDDFLVEEVMNRLVQFD